MFILEVLIICALFTVMVLIISRDPINTVDDFPPEIGKRCREMGLIKDGGSRKAFFLRKLLAVPMLGIALGLIVTFVNGAELFWESVMVSYAIWSCVDWYDCLILDFCWATRSKRLIIPGTEDLIDSYRNRWWHVKMSLIGMVLGIPVVLVAGVTTVVIR